MHKYYDLAYQANFGSAAVQAQAQLELWQQAQAAGAIPSSIFDLYQARAQGKTSRNWTVPAMNLKTLTFDSAQTIFQVAKEKRVGAFILEIARSEMDYAKQTPAQFMASVLAGALAAGWQGPIYLQGDHFQTKSKDDHIDQVDVDQVKALIKQAIAAGFYQIDIDGSLLIAANDQNQNARYSAELAEFITQQNTKGVTISLGAEISPIGGTNNSQPEDLQHFMEAFQQSTQVQLNKIAIQTGTSHGGILNPDGTVKKTTVSFETISTMSTYAQEKYDLAGVVQHGASTLNETVFAQFPQAGTLEIHLSTGFMNLILDHPDFPQELTQEIQQVALAQFAEERKTEQTDAQFIKKLRKKALGPLKQKLWDIPSETKQKIMQSFAEKVAFFFDNLQVTNTIEMVNKWTQQIPAQRNLADFQNHATTGTISELAD